MSLLNVRVKKARYIGAQAQQLNTYVTLKLRNVKTTTVTVKGANPCWEQDFGFEINDVTTGMLVEVWSKGVLWDSALGYHYIPLPEVPYSNEDGSGDWVSLDSELEMREGEVVGTKTPTGHSLLIDCRFEPPLDPENTGAADFQRKLEMLNTMDQEVRAEQIRRQMLYNAHSGYSEDSDYTSDLNYPVGPVANSSVSQFRTAANQLATPQRSLETSRENSYERDDHQVPGSRLTGNNYGYTGRGHSPRYDESYPEEGPPQRYSTAQQNAESSEPLFYNSRPKHYKEYRRRKHTWDYEDSQDGWYSEGYDYYGTKVDETRIYSDTEYYPSTTTSTSSRRRAPHRRPSLERQTTLYDEHSYYDGYSNDSRMKKMSATYPECQTDIGYNKYYNNAPGYMYQDERYGQDDEDRQWDSGGKMYPGTSTYYENKRNRKTLPQRPASSIDTHRPDYRPSVTRQRSYESEELNYSGRRKLLQAQQRSFSRLEGTGKKLPPIPTVASRISLSRKPTSLPSTPGRQLPRTRTPSEESYYKSEYNEDYNYAYRSQDNLPQDVYTEPIYTDQMSYNEQHISQAVPDNQYVADYSTQPATDQLVSTAYIPPSSVQDTYMNEYKVADYQEPYVPSTAYPGAYDDTTYPTISQAADQYDKTQDIVMQDSYQNLDYVPDDSQSYDARYDVPYSKYDATVPTSIYDQNNVYEEKTVYEEKSAYDYSQNQYGDNQYKVSTSAAYESYDETYNQMPATSEAPYQETYQDTYQDTYKEKEEYQDPYKMQEPYDDSYRIPYSKEDDMKMYETDQFDGQYQNQDQYRDQSQDQYSDQSQYEDQTKYESQNQYRDQSQYEDQSKYQMQDQYQVQDQYQSQDQYQIQDQYQSLDQSQDQYREKIEYQDQYQDYQDQYQDSYQNSYQDSFDDTYKDSVQSEPIERRVSDVPELSVTTPRGKTNGYAPSESEFYYPTSEAQTISATGQQRRLNLSKRDTSPLVQQNTDSLESKDDELKNSFDTAVSSVSSSQYKKGVSEYSTAGESMSSPVLGTMADSPQAMVQPTSDAVITTTAQIHTSVINGKKLTRTESYHEELMEDEESYQDYPEIIPKEPRRKDSQLSHQSQQSQHSSTHSQKPRLQRNDSYASDHFPDEYRRRESVTQQSRKDSYSSINQDFMYQKKGSMGQNYIVPQPIFRAESLQRGHFKEIDPLEGTDFKLSGGTVNGDFIMSRETLERYERGEQAMHRASRENSLIETYNVPTSESPREGSIQMDTPPRSPPEPLADEEILDMVKPGPIPTQLKERPDMTAKQRWHWAYNKIIMQLNVSTEKMYNPRLGFDDRDRC